MYVIIIYFYFFLCLLILFYTIGYVLFQSSSDQHHEKRVKRYVKLILKYQQLIRENGFNRYHKHKHDSLLFKKLKRLNHLIAFDSALNQFKQKKIPIDEYLIQMEIIIKKLVVHYQSKNDVEQGYLAWFIASYSNKNWIDPLIYQTLHSYLKGSNVYLRENVLVAAYRQPDLQWIIKAFQTLTENNLYHNSKLIQDGLLSHPYDRELLARKLWEHHAMFNQPIIEGIIDFITYQSDQFKEVFYQLLQKKPSNIEVKTRAMRYFRRHHYPKVEPLLTSLTSDSEDTIRIVAAHVLSSYPSANVIKVLKKALTDSNWYVRRNASQSLVEMNVSRTDISDVLAGQDLFAKEMLSYHIVGKSVTS